MENSIIKTVSDYVELVHERYPELSEIEIRKILNFGWRRYYYVNLMGCDTLIKDDITHKFTAFTGNLYTDPFKAYNAVKTKRRLYERMIAKLKKVKWDGYYYFGLTCDQYNKLLKDLNSKKQYIELHNKIYTRLLGELRYDRGVDYIFKFKYSTYVGFRFFQKKLKIRKKDLHFVELNNLNICRGKNKQILSKME